MIANSDPTGLIRACGPDGVLCGVDPRLHAPGTTEESEQYLAERRAVHAYKRAVQQFSAGVAAKRSSMAV